MSAELIILLVMLGTFAVAVFAFKLPAGLALMLGAVTGALADGTGVPVRHLVEGGFGFLDAILIIATAMIFMKVMDGSGALGTITYYMIKWLHRYPTVLLIVIVVFVMFPGMLTGLSSACILTTGALVAPGLIAMGMSRVAVGSLIAMAAIFGEIAPPICIPVMIICGGVDMPYVGFARPLFLASIPPALAMAVFYRLRYLRRFDVAAVLEKLPKPVYSEHGPKLFLPLILVVTYLVLEQTIPGRVPELGVPLIFVLGAVVGLFCGNRMRWYGVSRQAMRDALPVMAILVGVGMFMQILTLTGVRGFLAVKALYLPEGLKYLAGLIMPFFGSAYAAASVIGVPLVFVFIGKNEIVITAGLALLAVMGDLMPPPSLLCAYAAQIVKVENHFQILKKCVPMMAVAAAVALAMIVWAKEIASVFF
jgi:TRAP-type C4-dicarboxylate transport system permease large subunit